MRLLFKANIHQKFAVIDQKIVWYGSINLLSYGSAQESLMRLEGPKYRPGIAERSWEIDQRLIAWMTKPSFFFLLWYP